MPMKRQRLLDEICQTAPKHELVSLIEVLGSVLASRIRLVQEAYSKEASVTAGKLRLPAEPGIRSPRRSEARGDNQHVHW